jgi:uroporphyrinogen decarboxylase
MVAGRGTPDQMPARRMALDDPAGFARLIAVLVDASAQYLIAQLQAGADVVKIFDSWAGVLDEAGFRAWAIEPVRRIVGQVRAACPGARIIAFPKGAGARLGRYAEQTGVDAVAVDWTLPLRDARQLVSGRVALQGNLDPLRLVVGGTALDEGIDAVLDAMDGRAHIFNLGHGITPDTPVAHVEQLVRRVRERAA